MMKYIYKIVKIALLLGVLASSEAGAVSFLNGAAQLSYVKYDAENEGKSVYSGDSFAQKYSINWGATNYLRPTQPEYYKLLLGYDWISFDTSTVERNLSNKLSDTYGKFRYSGSFGLQPVHLPFKFNAYVYDDTEPRFRQQITQSLLPDDLYFAIDNKNKVQRAGFSFVFEPALASSLSVRGLPRILVDYREIVNKSDTGFTYVDNKTRELAVAGLNKENNWLHYRNIKFENYINPSDNFEQQQIQIGLVDYIGRRKWSPLTNWIMVSADGQLTTRRNVNDYDSLEEYDLNFQAIATRKQWDARTFMNYNREITRNTLTESEKIPLYVKGFWGRDTNWFANASESRTQQQPIGGSRLSAYDNTVSFGFTTFMQSMFTLSPYLLLNTNQSLGGGDGYLAEAKVTTSSTRRFSDLHSILASYKLKINDDGFNSPVSNTWYQRLTAKDRYRPSNSYSFEAEQELEQGSGSSIGFGRVDGVLDNTATIKKYILSRSKFLAAWNKSAEFRTSAAIHYDIIKIQGLPLNSELQLSHNINFDRPKTTLQMTTQYLRRDDGNGSIDSLFSNSGVMNYNPDRYNKMSLRYAYDDSSYPNSSFRRLEITQRYDRLFYSKVGVLRNIATISEEYSKIYSASSETAIDSQYLLIAGRYSPTSRLTLYGSAKFQEEPTAYVMFYNAGLYADFKLMTTSLDYTLATSDLHKRKERKLMANVTRTF